MNKTSSELFQQAKHIFPGGVNSPVRSFRSVGGVPPFIERGQGAWIYDVEKKAYIDYVLSYGPLILGHAHHAVVDAIVRTAQRGTSFGMPTPLAIQLAELIRSKLPSVEMLRFVNSGTEAVMSAIRLARAATGKTKVIKFEGCYHGHVDSLLVQAGSGVATLGLPDSPGVTSGTTADTLTAPYNDLDAVARLLDVHRHEVAAIIVEPVAGNMNFVPPIDGFLSGLRQQCDRSGALLIFDEVMTGFRVDLNGAQGLFGINPDLTTLGKVIGGGLPVGAFGGRADIMRHLAPLGKTYQAGTLSANPLAMAAGIATLQQLFQDGYFADIVKVGMKLDEGWRGAAASAGIPITVSRMGTMSGIHFQKDQPRNWTEVNRGDVDLFTRVFHSLLNQGIFLAPSSFEASFISSAHSESEIQQTIEAVTSAFAAQT